MIQPEKLESGAADDFSKDHNSTIPVFDGHIRLAGRTNHNAGLHEPVVCRDHPVMTSAHFLHLIGHETDGIASIINSQRQGIRYVGGGVITFFHA